MPHSAKNLRGWLNEPVVQDAVVHALTKVEYPLTLSEVAVACDVSIAAANSALLRLHKKGFVRRYRLPMQRHAYCHRRKACVPGGATRLLYVYAWADSSTAEIAATRSALFKLAACNTG